VRILGLILVILGALALGYQSFTDAVAEKARDNGPIPVAIEKEKTVFIPPVVGGIVVVCGLLLLATGNRKD